MPSVTVPPPAWCGWGGSWARAPIPWQISRVEDLDSATPLPRTEWKLPLARALVKRALAALG